MLRGLEGRRIALFGGSGDAGAEVRKELIAAGAVLSELPGSSDDAWHSGMYAGLVLMHGKLPKAETPKLRQLIQEFFVAEKPVAAFDADAEALSLDESLLAVNGATDPRQFAREVVRDFSARLEEHDVDEMSELSFPASDPPAVNPGTAGPAPNGDRRV